MNYISAQKMDERSFDKSIPTNDTKIFYCGFPKTHTKALATGAEYIQERKAIRKLLRQGASTGL